LSSYVPAIADVEPKPDLPLDSRHYLKVGKPNSMAQDMLAFIGFGRSHIAAIAMQRRGQGRLPAQLSIIDAPTASDRTRRSGTREHAVGVCHIIAVLRKAAVPRQPRTTLAAYHSRCRPVAPDRAALVRKLDQFAKKHFLRNAAFLFSH
jgi:hypothetical protein